MMNSPGLTWSTFALILAATAAAATPAGAQSLDLGLLMPATTFYPGAPCWLKLAVANPGPAYPAAQLFVALDIGIGEYWFHPSWRHYPPDLDWEDTSFAAGVQEERPIIPEFAWPAGAGEFAGAAFIAAVLVEGGLGSNVAIVTFGWSEEPPATPTPAGSATATPTRAPTFTPRPSLTPTPTPSPTATGGAATTLRASVASGGEQANNESGLPGISADGRYVVFYTWSNNLFPGDVNGENDVVLRDLEAGTTELVSQATDGTLADGESLDPRVSAGGRYVVFWSEAANLVAGDTNLFQDVFVRDRQAGTTERASVGAGGVQGDGWSASPAMSDDGRYVAFESQATNLVAGDSNDTADIFVRDRQTGLTERVSVATGGGEGNEWSTEPAISADGRYVAFSSWASNLVTGDANEEQDVFVHDRQTGVTERISVSSSGTEANLFCDFPALSGDGRHVAFVSFADNLVAGDTNSDFDVFVHDRQTGITERVSVSSSENQANAASSNPGLSGDGRYVAFVSSADNLVAGDGNGSDDVFVRDRTAGTTEIVSSTSTGTQANSESGLPAVSADGRHVAFESYADNLVPGDTNDCYDVFVRRRW